MTKQERKAEKRLLYYLAAKEREYKQEWHTYEKNLFAECKGTRTRKRARNTWSKEQAGTCGTYIATKRFANSRLTCVCKSRNMF